MVIIFTSTEFCSFSAEYSVVVFPEPVGPVTRIIPCGRLMSLLNDSSSASEKPTSSRSSEMTERSSTRITTLSPKMVGRVETRRSTGLPPTTRSILPSCGSRRSEMSRFAMTFMREVMGSARCFGGGVISYSMPSTL